MSLATRGIGPGAPLTTWGLGPGSAPLILNATVTPGVILVPVTLPGSTATGAQNYTTTPGVIQLIVAVYSPVAGEVPDFELRLEDVYTGQDAGVITRHDALVLVSHQNRKDIMADYIMRQDQDGPPIGFRWLDYTKQLLDFSTGWVFELQIVTYSGSIEATVPNGNISGSAGDTVQPNVVIDWPAGFFTNVPVDQYMMHLKATGSGKTRFFSLDRLPTLEVVPALVAAP